MCRWPMSEWKIPDRKLWLGDGNNVMHRKRARRISGILKKVSELNSWLGRRRLTFACSPKSGHWPCARCRSCFGADGKGSIERLCLSPYVEKPLYSKVIKSFVPELRSCKCFSCFGIPMFYIYVIYRNIMNVLRTGMNMSISLIHIWLCYNCTQMVSSIVNN